MASTSTKLSTPHLAPQKQTTDAALKELLAERGVYKRLKVTSDAVRNWRARLSNLDEGKKMQILKLAGFEVVQERLWSAKSK